MSEQDAGDRDHAPTPKKLEEARRRGDVPRSADLASAFALAGFLVALMATGPLVVNQLGALSAALLGQADRLADGLLVAGGGPGGIILAVAGATSPLFLLPAIGAVLGHLIQRGWTFTPANLVPQLSRVSMFSNLRQRLGPSGLVEFVKSLAKAGLVIGVAVTLIRGRLDDFVGTAHLPAGAVSLYLAAQLRDFAVAVVVLTLAIGIGDSLWQNLRFLLRNRMTRKEIMDELKDAEGDPHARSQRRQRGQDLAMNQMLAEVPRADVVIVNPTHYAVALRWDKSRGSAPVCVAKGVDEVAARIRAAASEAGVPIRHDPPTARAIHATVDIGAQIHPDHYRAVAAAIRFAEAMRRRARRR